MTTPKRSSAAAGRAGAIQAAASAITATALTAALALAGAATAGWARGGQSAGAAAAPSGAFSDTPRLWLTAGPEERLRDGRVRHEVSVRLSPDRRLGPTEARVLVRPFSRGSAPATLSAAVPPGDPVLAIESGEMAEATVSARTVVDGRPFYGETVLRLFGRGRGGTSLAGGRPAPETVPAPGEGPAGDAPRTGEADPWPRIEVAGAGSWPREGGVVEVALGGLPEAGGRVEAGPRGPAAGGFEAPFLVQEGPEAPAAALEGRTLRPGPYPELAPAGYAAAREITVFKPLAGGGSAALTLRVFRQGRSSRPLGLGALSAGLGAGLAAGLGAARRVLPRRRPGKDPR